MAYFSNGSEGCGAESRNCDLCQHQGEHDSGETGCPILLIHALYNYDQRKEGQAILKHTMDILWPRQKDGFAGKCSFLRHKTAEQQTEQFNFAKGE